MKKVLAFVVALALVFGIGFGSKQVHDQAGDPPIGGFAPDSTEVTADLFDVVNELPSINTTDGNPPIGG
jgi:hypothetical protein